MITHEAIVRAAKRMTETSFALTKQGDGVVMYKLVNRRGRTVNMKSGEPFIYTTEWTARLGKKFLEQKRKEKLRIVELT